MSKEFKPMKFGCGRCVQAPGAVEIVGREAAMLKSKKALIVGGKQALDSVGAKMEASLKEAGVEPYFYTMTSDCTYETLDYLQNTLIPQQKADLVIGTRSAVFAPVRNLGLIVMDEEHEHTYKSESDPKYHAKDVAAYRAGKNNALMLLASATPSIESFYKAQTGAYTLVPLRERYGGAKLPKAVITAVPVIRPMMAM